MRKGISSFHLATNTNEIIDGLNMLEKDILSGKVHQIIKKYNTKLGDYMFVTAEKI